MDDLYLLPIYPAREKPMPGVTSDVLLAKITAKSKQLIAKEELVDAFELTSNQVVLTVGAGDIDQAATAAFEHRLTALTGHEEDAGQVDLEHFLPN